MTRDARTASRLPRTFGHVPPTMKGSVLVYQVQTPPNPLPFLGLGAGWSAPTREAPQVARQIGREAEVLIYSARSRTVNLMISIYSSEADTLTITVGGRSHSRMLVRPGQQQLVLPLAITPGQTIITLQHHGTEPLTVTTLDLSNQTD